MQHHRGLVLAFEGSDVLEGDRGRLRETVHQAASCSDISAAWGAAIRPAPFPSARSSQTRQAPPGRTRRGPRTRAGHGGRELRQLASSASATPASTTPVERADRSAGGAQAATVLIEHHDDGRGLQHLRGRARSRLAEPCGRRGEVETNGGQVQPADPGDQLLGMSARPDDRSSADRGQHLVGLDRVDQVRVGALIEPATLSAVSIATAET